MKVGVLLQPLGAIAGPLTKLLPQTVKDVVRMRSSEDRDRRTALSTYNEC
jgi:hypothetical protein